MKNREIYELSLSLLAQQIAGTENEDFEDRAPFLLASFCSEACDLDRYLRQRAGIGGTYDFEKVRVDLDEDFPLLERLAPLAGLYLAAMLIIDEDDTLSDTLYDRYCDGMTALRCGIPCSVEEIINAYPSL